MIEDILPPAVASAEMFDDPDTVLLPEEAAILGSVVESRRREFTTGRACARLAMARIGLAAVPVTQGAKFAPQWPPGVVGSITHCSGYRAAAVAHATDVSTIGIDAEPNLTLPNGILTEIATSQELEWLDEFSSATPTVCWDRLLFSAKEAAFKAWFPLTGRWLGFEDAVTTVDPIQRTFSIRLVVPGPSVDRRELTGFSGRWLLRDGLLLTAIVLPVAHGSVPEA